MACGIADWGPGTRQPPGSVAPSSEASSGCGSVCLALVNGTVSQTLGCLIEIFEVESDPPLRAGWLGLGFV